MGKLNDVMICFKASILESSIIWKHPRTPRANQQHNLNRKRQKSGCTYCNEEASCGCTRHVDDEMTGGPISNFHAEQRNDPLVRELRRVREQNAQRYKEDYSHVFRNKSRWDFIRLSFVIMGIEFVYSAETAFVSPILLGIGVEHQLMTLVWALSPLVGFFLAPILGTISDRCRYKMGRRRPILLGLAVTMIIGCILVPFGENFGKLLGDLGEFYPEATTNGTEVLNSNLTAFLPYEFYRVEREILNHEMDYKWAIFITIVGVLLMDFSADTAQTPARAYLLDTCVPEDHGRACSTFSIMAGIGGSMGYMLGGINWDVTSFGDFLGGSIKTVFTIVGVIFIICLILTVTSFREIPLPLMEKDELLRPLTEAIVKKERAKMNDKIFYVKDVSRTFAMQLQTIDETVQPPAPQMINNALAAEAEKKDQKDVADPASTSMDSDAEEEEKSMTLKDFLKSIVMMPKSIAILCLTNLFCWMGHLSFCLYFTDFVGEEVFHGNPAAPSNSESYQQYLEGVRYGCFGLAIYSLSCSCYSFTIEKLIKILRARIVYCGGLLIDAVGMILMAVYPNKVTVFVFSATGGIVYALLFTMPFLLIGQYHAKGQFKVSKSSVADKPEKKRGLATDIAVVGGMIFLAQIIISLGLGSLIEALGTTAAVIYSAGTCSFLAALTSTQIVYMDL